MTAEGMRERALRYDRDCAVLTRAAAVLIAITIDPTAVGRLDPEVLAFLEQPEAPQETPAPSPETVSERPPTPPATVSPDPPAAVVAVESEPTPGRPVARTTTPTTGRDARWRPRGAVRVLGGLGLGDLPATGGGLGGGAALVFRHLRLELVAELWPARSARIAGTESGADFLLWTLGPRLCGVIHPHRLVELPLCAGFEAGKIHVANVRLQNNSDNRAGWFAVVLAPSLAVVPLRRLAVWFAPQLIVPATRPTFIVDDRGALHRAQPVAGRFMVGVELRFP